MYAVLTNEQLAQVVQKNVQSIAGLKEVEGVGEARIAKYGYPPRSGCGMGFTPDPKATN